MPNPSNPGGSRESRYRVTLEVIQELLTEVASRAGGVLPLWLWDLRTWVENFESASVAFPSYHPAYVRNAIVNNNLPPLLQRAANTVVNTYLGAATAYAVAQLSVCLKEGRPPLRCTDRREAEASHQADASTIVGKFAQELAVEQGTANYYSYWLSLTPSILLEQLKTWVQAYLSAKEGPRTLWHRLEEDPTSQKSNTVTPAQKPAASNEVLRVSFEPAAWRATFFGPEAEEWDEYFWDELNDAH